MDLHLGYRFLLVGLILALNAFFSGAEVALLSVRQSRLKQMAADGVAGAQAAIHLLSNPELLLSVVQVGVTLASLGMGWAGEDSVFYALKALLWPWVTQAREPYLHAAAFIIAFLIITYLHVVLGEVVPKNLAIEKADRLAILVAPPLVVFSRLVGPFVRIIERSASLLSRLIGLKGDAAGASHSAEELKFIIASSGRHGHLEPFVDEAIQRLLGLDDLNAREIMIPRSNFVSVPVTTELDALLRAFAENKYSRILVYQDKPENVLGFVFAKDMLELWSVRRHANEKRRPAPGFEIRRFLREPLIVPETKPLTQLIDSFRSHHSHMAIVVDEFGSVTGLLTLEDVMEQIFGEIEDEHDVRLPALPAAWEELKVDGTISIVDLESQYQIELPSNAGFETLAGFLMFELGRIPEEGEQVEFSGMRFTVQEMAHNRVRQVRIERV
jgi:CBS domain containing-hemolysin-like protein